MSIELRTVADGFKLPESPRWRDGCLWMSDIIGGRIVTITSEAGVRTEIDVPHRPSGIGWAPDGTFRFISQVDRALMAWDGRTARRHADLSAYFDCVEGDVRPNDMTVDAFGRAYIGSASFGRTDGGALVADNSRPTPLVRVDPDGSATTLLEDLKCPNGIAISADGRTMVIAETRASKLTAFTVDERGDLLDRRTFAETPSGPDGICFDDEGFVWAAFPFSHEVLRVAEGGEVLERIDFGSRLPVACMLGGSAGSTLFIASVEVIDHSGNSVTGRCDAATVPQRHAGLP
jgi:sugar lactone lactonase YvrE